MTIVGLLLAGFVVVVPASGQAPVSPLSSINGLREDEELATVAASADLDAVAKRYLDAMLAARCLCPVEEGQTGTDRLLADVRTALDVDAAIIDAGLMIGYDQSAEAAMRTVVFDPANGAAILGVRMTRVGIATGVVETGESWLVPPSGGVGPEIELSGYTLVVVVMAGAEE